MINFILVKIQVFLCYFYEISYRGSAGSVYQSVNVPEQLLWVYKFNCVTQQHFLKMHNSKTGACYL